MFIKQKLNYENSENKLEQFLEENPEIALSWRYASSINYTNFLKMQEEQDKIDWHNVNSLAYAYGTPEGLKEKGVKGIINALDDEEFENLMDDKKEDLYRSILKASSSPKAFAKYYEQLRELYEMLCDDEIRKTYSQNFVYDNGAYFDGADITFKEYDLQSFEILRNAILACAVQKGYSLLDMCASHKIDEQYEQARKNDLHAKMRPFVDAELEILKENFGKISLYELNIAHEISKVDAKRICEVSKLKNVRKMPNYSKLIDRFESSLEADAETELDEEECAK